MPLTFHDGKDEMNFAHAPLGILSKREDGARKTLVFENTINDRETVRRVRRKLTEARLIETLALLRGTEAFTRVTPGRRAEFGRDVMRTEWGAPG